MAVDYSGLHSKLQEVAREIVGQKGSYWLFLGDEMNETRAIASMSNEIVARYHDPKARIIVEAASIVYDLMKEERTKSR